MNETPKVLQQFANFQAALNQLIAYTQEPVLTDRDRSGIIQAFEFTFEQTWIFFQKKAESLGEKAPGPKPALEIALRYGWITTPDEEHWLGMLKDRNMTSHLYRVDISRSVFERIMSNYLPLFKSISI